MQDIQKGQLFAVTRGSYFGSNIVCISIGDDMYNFLDLNDMTNIHVPVDEIILAIENNILELLDTLPVDIIEICTKQYEKNTYN